MGNIYTKKLKEKIYKARHQETLIKYMIKKGKLNHESKPLINWRAIKRAGKFIPQHKQKLAHQTHQPI